MGAEHRHAPGRGPLHGQQGRVRPGLGEDQRVRREVQEKEKLELFNKLKELREFLDRQSTAFVGKEVTKGQKEIVEATLKKEDFKKRLEGYRAGLEGYKAALEKLEASILAIK